MTDDDDDGAGTSPEVSRRAVLQATGLAAVADLTALGDRSTGASEVGLGPEDDPYTAFAARLPAPDALAEGRYEATLSPQLADGVLAAPAVLAGADAHASILAPRASVTLGLGGVDSAETIGALEACGYHRSEDIAGRPTYVRRGRYSQRLAAVDDGTVALARGPKVGPVTSLVREVLAPVRAPLEKRLPRVATVLDAVAGGAVLSVSPRDGPAPTGGSAAPVVTGTALTPVPDGSSARLRSAAAYASRAAREAALAGPPPGTGLGKPRDRVAEHGVVHQRAVPTAELPLSE